MDASCDHSQLQSWLHLVYAGAPVEHNLYQLLENFGAADAVVDAARAGLINRSCLPGKVLERLRNPDRQEIAQYAEWLTHPGHHLITFDSLYYPALLKQIPTPPLALFLRGDPKALATRQVAIVGSRRPTIDGRKDARHFAAQLALQGLTVTSGLAKGIDTEAHNGALARQGRTVAVIGSGLACIYPPTNTGLADRISENGALVSEFPLSWPPFPANFARRNRIISGLSAGVLVVEAARRSGSLITARHALAQNREVFAVPGSIHNPMKQGCHGLLREGAGLVTRLEDILEGLEQFRIPEASAPAAVAVNAATNKALDEREKVLLDNIGYESTSLDEIVGLTGFGIEDIMGKLLKLELEGLIKVVAPGSYTRAGPET